MILSRNHLHVAVGVISNDKGQILISRRHEDQDQGGLWEFPGGKVSRDENIEQALNRELKEELGIQVESTRPFIKIHHNYSEYSVLLDVWKVNKFSGFPSGCEGQDIDWIDINHLSSRKFPEGNYFIVSALNLPSVYFITPEPDDFRDENEFLFRLKKILTYGCKLIQFRAKKKPLVNYQALISEIQLMCKSYKARLLVNSTPEIFSNMDVDGIHLSSDLLMQQKQRPITKDKLLAVSCHNKQELERAVLIDADFIVLGSVSETDSHPGIKALGWDTFSELVEDINIPVYALGGMKCKDLEHSWSCGGQGLAMISDLWDRTVTENNFYIEE